MDVHSAAAPPPTDEQLLASARRALEIEARALAGLTPRLGSAFARACRICLDCQGRVVVTGMGKSGHIAGKIAATLASTGTPAFFLHPAEAGHGDLGMITRTDAVLALSNSGETPELILLLPHLKRLSVPLMVMSGRSDSTLGYWVFSFLASSFGLRPPLRPRAVVAASPSFVRSMIKLRSNSANAPNI